MATGSDDHVVNLWRIQENEIKNTRSLSGHESAIKSIVFDPTEHTVVAGAHSGLIKVFDLEAGNVSQTLKGHRAAATTVDYHLYGDYVASGSHDTIVKVWDLRTESCMQTFKGHSSEVTAVSFTPDGRWLTSGDQDGVIRIWDLTAGRLLKEFSDHGGAITSLEFNPEDFILVSSAADRTIRFWNVQEFAVIGATPVDSATTTSMCHTVAEPYSGKYLFCCSQNVIRVWSYETAIECHDSMAMPRQKELGHVAVHADTIMTQDMKLMSGCIQNAFVSVWMLDVMQLQPFDRATSHNDNDRRVVEARKSSGRLPSARIVTLSDPVRANESVPQSTAVATLANVLGAPAHASRVPAHKVSDGIARANSLMRGNPVSCGSNHRDASCPTTPGVLVPLTGAKSIRRPARLADDSSQPVDAPRPVSAGIGIPNDLTRQQPEGPRETAAHPPPLPPHPRGEELVTPDFVSELRCGMDTCVKAFEARQKYIQQLLVHWEKGRLSDGLRYIGELPKGKREAVVVDVLRITNLQSLGVDLEACVLLLPLIVEVLESKFELHVNIGVESGHKLLNAFSPIVKNNRDAQQYHSQAINLAGEKRAQQCKACDMYFQEMQQRVQHVAETCTSSALQSKVHRLARALNRFYS